MYSVHEEDRGRKCIKADLSAASAGVGVLPYSTRAINKMSLLLLLNHVRFCLLMVFGIFIDAVSP